MALLTRFPGYTLSQLWHEDAELLRYLDIVALGGGGTDE